jgi:membrane associated rhomboid family serine protease
MSDEDVPRRREPILNLPPVTGALAAVTVAVHLVRLLLPAEVDGAILFHFAFIPLRYSIPDLFGWAAIVSPLSYLFLHGGGLHLVMNLAMLVSFGSGVERRIGGGRTLIFYLLTGVLAAFIHFAVYSDSTTPVVGASGAISGLFGAIVMLLHRRGAGGKGPQNFGVLVAVWVVFTVVTGLIGVPGEPEIEVAWVAHLGGFAAGLLLFPLFDPK